ncbi:hypothetical protein K469DRAFT_706472 [Zopfia rhizophila CBS 207.26]|uniref:Uncharacterized protein n=1 Tax=Zopfia rhizophila CBS 207.26 TaxID=1314779 RepID=A0A6A6E3I1_9PEZI|nr:hypothetical protein K469DRAFT_706472 [Zopfia rhizophila CBS 207.26]
MPNQRCEHQKSFVLGSPDSSTTVYIFFLHFPIVWDPIPMEIVTYAIELESVIRPCRQL